VSTVNRHLVMPAAVALAGMAVLVNAAACADTPAGSRSAQCPRRAAGASGSLVSQGHGASFDSVSCASAGNCTAGGQYPGGSGRQQGLVVSQVHGAWGEAVGIPGLAALNTGGDAEVSVVSCGSAGDCGAGGDYTNGLIYAGTHYQQNASQAFVASEVNGAWCTAEEIPGVAALNKGRDAGLSSMSCPSAGNCSAVGSYSSLAPNQSQTESSGGFVVSQVNGIWGRARPVPGSSGLNSVSCVSPGNCTAVGDYNASRPARASVFVISQTRGVWGRPDAVPGFAALNQGANGDIYSVSCASAGNCSSTGFYTDSAARDQAFVVDERHGIWQQARQIPGTSAPSHTDVEPGPVSCGSPGNCTAGGLWISSGSSAQQAFLASQVNGVWKPAEDVRGGMVSQGGNSQVAAISCASAGSCTAAGSYGGDGQLTFAVSEVHGVWGAAQQIPRVAGDLTPVSCAAPGNCAMAGSSGYLASQVNGMWRKAVRIYPPARS
jgi:hypothetical protein